MKIKFIFCHLVIIRLFLIAQTDDPDNSTSLTFKVEKYTGKIDKYPITMLLTFYPDSNISGYYYYDNIGHLLNIQNYEKNKSRILHARQIALYANDVEPDAPSEIMEFTRNIFENKDTLNGKWLYNKKVYSIDLIKENLKLDWRLFRYKSFGYFKDSPFTEQTTDISTIYPSISSSPQLNAYFLHRYNFMDKNLVDFINTTQSKYLQIEQNFGENTSEILDCCWSDEGSNKLAYISDSILTYNMYSYTYGYRGYDYSEFISVNISSGEEYSTKNIFKEESIDTVLALLRNKYKNVLPQEETNYNINNEPNFNPNFDKDSRVYLIKGGLYFRHRLDNYNLDNYYDLYLSYKEISNFLTSPFKLTVGIQ